MNEELIAPCGMNCAICSGYLALTHQVKEKGVRIPYCPGCRPRNKQCAFLKKRCALLANNSLRSCSQCLDFPCSNLQHLDKRHRSFFRMSMIENLQFIEKHGIVEFLKKEEEKWQCPQCGGIICCHNGLCFGCDLEVLSKKKKRFRWEDDE